MVIAATNARQRKDTEEHAKDFPTVELLPERKINVDKILEMKPEVVIVDDLAENKRWEEVDVLLKHGISVLSTLNVQNLESLSDVVTQITGNFVSETVPDRILHEAQEIETVDLTPKALINRLKRGDIFEEDRISEALNGLYKESTLSALRELALREAAGRVDEDVKELLKEHAAKSPWALQEKVLICVSPSHSSLRLIRRGWRAAQKLDAEVTLLYVREGGSNEAESDAIREDFTLADKLGIKRETVEGKVVESIINFARENGVTQIVIGHSNRSSLQQRLKGSVINDIIREMKMIDVLVVAETSQ